MRMARRMADVQASEIREILKLTEQPGMISFAGGLPDAKRFPLERMRQAATEALAESGEQALQYSTTEGYVPLRESIAERMRLVQGVACTSANVLITNGSQQGLDLSAKLFLDEGDTVLCERPTYLGAIQAFRAYGVRFVEVPTDEEGMDPEALQRALIEERPKFIYVNPDFQNPTGRTWSLERRQAFMNLIRQHEVTVIEDNPYGELRYSGQALPALKSLDTRGQVVYLGTFSKTLCPGLRIGWLVAAPELFAGYVLLKQGVDLHSSSLHQREIHHYLQSGDFDAHIANLRSAYRVKRDRMLEAINRAFPAEIRCTAADGGLFLWVELPERLDARELLVRCLERGVAFVPGESFYPNGGGKHTLRLNFSNSSEAQIDAGISRLAETLRAALEGAAAAQTAGGAHQ